MTMSPECNAVERLVKSIDIWEFCDSDSDFWPDIFFSDLKIVLWSIRKRSTKKIARLHYFIPRELKFLYCKLLLFFIRLKVSRSLDSNIFRNWLIVVCQILVHPQPFGLKGLARNVRKDTTGIIKSMHDVAFQESIGSRSQPTDFWCRPDELDNFAVAQLYRFMLPSGASQSLIFNSSEPEYICFKLFLFLIRIKVVYRHGGRLE